MNNDIHGGIISAYHVHCKYTSGVSSTLQLPVELQWKVGHVEKVYKVRFRSVDVTVNYCKSVLHLFHCTLSSN